MFSPAGEMNIGIVWTVKDPCVVYFVAQDAKDTFWGCIWGTFQSGQTLSCRCDAFDLGKQRLKGAPSGLGHSFSLHVTKGPNELCLIWLHIAWFLMHYNLDFWYFKWKWGTKQSFFWYSALQYATNTVNWACNLYWTPSIHLISIHIALHNYKVCIFYNSFSFFIY